MNKKLVAASVAILVGTAGVANSADFGQKVEQLLKSQSFSLFGVLGTLNASTSTNLDGPAIDANPLAAVNVAPGLSASVVSHASNLGNNIDMMVLWPNDSAPTHIIACNEDGGGTGTVQRIRLSDGVAENIVSSGLTSCDPTEITPWGTVIFGEENGSNGRVFEILDPLTTTNVTITGSGAGTTTSDPTHVAYRPALGQLSFEGVSVLPNGVVLYQDEGRPSASSNGGSYFKFIPTTLWTSGSPISDLSASPLTGGRIFGLRMGRNGGNTDIGGGNKAGRGVWVEVVEGQVISTSILGALATPVTIHTNNLPAAATALKLFASYRPEDQDIDKGALTQGKVRVCGTNTGQDTVPTSSDADNNFGETWCLTDGTVAAAAVINTTTQSLGGISYTVNNGAGTTTPEYQLLVTHFQDFGMPDNVAYQPGRGNWLINEDGDGATYSPQRNNDIWDCLDDGADQNLLSDGCVKVISINDTDAETTGGVFNATGTEYYFSMQHNSSGHAVIYKVTGWQ